MEPIKVLYAEDEPFLARIITDSLNSRGFCVFHAEDGSRALSMFRESVPDICVLDVMLPQRDGFDVAREIKKSHPHIPIIFLTAKTQTQDLLDGFASGGNDYLRKPFSMEELIVRMQNLLEMFSASRAEISKGDEGKPRSFASFVFYPQRYELHRGSHIRKLSHRENTLLDMLSRQGEKPVMRKEILLKVWGDDSWANSRNLDVYISRIREYLSADPLVEIVTIKGVGYHFCLRSRK